MYYLQYADDLMILTAWGIEDLKIIKLILFLYEGTSSLAISFQKICLFSTRLGEILDSSLAQILSYSMGMLHLIYLVSLFQKVPSSVALGEGYFNDQILTYFVENQIPLLLAN